jgi:hypothetical protein
LRRTTKSFDDARSYNEKRQRGAKSSGDDHNQRPAAIPFQTEGLGKENCDAEPSHSMTTATNENYDARPSHSMTPGANNENSDAEPSGPTTTATNAAATNAIPSLGNLVSPLTNHDWATAHQQRVTNSHHVPKYPPSNLFSHNSV